MAKKKICIEWEGPLTQHKAAQAEGEGVYQFYGWHPAYGEGALLYIGSACRFNSRLSQHEFLGTGVPAFFRPEEVKIHLGRIMRSEGIALEVIEGMLISVHTPAWNSDKIRIITAADCDVKIRNTGSRGALRETFTITPEGVIKSPD